VAVQLIWVFSSGFASFSVSFEVCAYAVVDICSKVLLCTEACRNNMPPSFAQHMPLRGNDFEISALRSWPIISVLEAADGVAVLTARCATTRLSSPSSSSPAGTPSRRAASSRSTFKPARSYEPVAAGA
jgi:hypothetical protein